MNYDYTGEPLWYHKILLDMLPYITDLLDKIEVKYWLDWGTLVGAMRNGKMVPWDFDIDIGIFHDDAELLLSYEPTIRADGYRFAVDRNAKFARKIRFFTEKHGFDFHIDLDPWDVNDGTASATFDQSKTHPVGELRNLTEIEFEGAMYPCPNPPEAALIREFGPDWRIPKVQSGNCIYVKKFAPDNKDIQAEIKRHGEGY